MRRFSLTMSVAVLSLSSTAALAQGPGGPGGPGGRGFQSPVIAALDTDGDGELSAKEIENATVALKKLDKNSDGKLTTDELRPAGGPGSFLGAGTTEERVARVMAFDKNSDGKISKDELPERMQVLMDRADTNKDGSLDKAEVTAMAERAGAGGRGGRGGAGGGRGGRGGQPQPN